MLIQPHEFGRFGSRAGRNVFTIQDLDNNETTQTSRTTISRSDDSAEISKKTSSSQSFARINVIAAAALGILATLLSIALLITGVGTSASLILVAVLLTTLLAINLCHFVCLFYNSHRIACKN